MSANPLHHKNNEKEIYDISMFRATDDGLIVEFSFGPYRTSENCTKELPIEFAEIEFFGPVRVDYYSDEGYNQSFGSQKGFKNLDAEFPGVIYSDNSDYLNEYKKKEEWAAICHEDRFRHFVVWSYGGGVIHVLSDNDPVLKKGVKCQSKS